MHTTHADIAAGALYLSLTYFVSSRPSPRALTMSLISAGLLISTKISGLILVGLLSPWVLWLAWRHGRSMLTHRLLSFSAFAAMVLGLSTPIRNFVHTHNPVYPARVTLLGVELFEGPLEEEAVAGGLSFLRSPNAIPDLIERWYREPGEPYPDIRERPFGRAVNYVVFPFAVLGLVCLAKRHRWVAVQLVCFALAALMVPAPWWGRFVLGLPGIALIAASAWLTWLAKFHLATRAAAWACFAALATFQVWDLGAHFIGYRNTPVLAGLEARRNERDLRADKRWLWSSELISAREAELGPGDLVVHDQSVQFLSELWNSAGTSRLAFRHSEDPSRFNTEVEALNPKWVAVTKKSSAEVELLRRHPSATPVGHLPMAEAAMYRLR